MESVKGEGCVAVISQIALGQGLGLGELWRHLRERLKGRYVEIWPDVFEEGMFWVADDARAALEAVTIPFEVVHRVPAEQVRVFHAPQIRPDPDSLPEEDSVRARTLAGHGIGAVLFFVGDGTQMPPEEPSDPRDALFYLSRPGARYYCLWRLFRSKEDAERHVVQKFPGDERATRWVTSIPVLAYAELLENTGEGDGR
jgi:hypothetical protein